MRILEGHDLFDSTVVAALTRWRHEPYLVDGAPTPWRGRVSFDFRVRDIIKGTFDAGAAIAVRPAWAPALLLHGGLLPSENFEVFGEFAASPGNERLWRTTALGVTVYGTFGRLAVGPRVEIGSSTERNVGVEERAVRFAAGITSRYAAAGAGGVFASATWVRLRFESGADRVRDTGQLTIGYVF